MMYLPKFFSIKTGLAALALLALLWLVPETFIYSQSSRSTYETSQIDQGAQRLISAETGNKTAPATSAGSKTVKPSPKTSTAAASKGSSGESSLTDSPIGQIQRPSLVTQFALLSFMSLLPFIMMLMTSFLKIVVVLSLLRTALGVQQAPPNAVINGVGFLLSIFIMYPTGIKMYEAANTTLERVQVPDSILSPDSSTYVIEVAKAASEPLRGFIKRNSSPKHQALFFRLVYRNLPEEFREKLKPDDFIVLVPSYITGQLKDAFEIGVLIYLPFFVIDLVTSNILLAMGMMMLSPVTISMPLKLFLLVMLDGWTILIEGLVKTFQ